MSENNCTHFVNGHCLKNNDEGFFLTMTISFALSSIACLSIILSYILFKELRTI